MDITKSVLLVVINLFIITRGFGMNDVCPTGDKSCMEPIFGLGLLKWDKCSKTGVLLRYQKLSLLQCVKECFVTSQCTSINFRQNWDVCEVVTAVTNSNDMDDDSKCVKSYISSWEKSLAGKCVDHTCAAGSKCQFDHMTTNVVCIDAYCKDLPYIPNAKTVEHFGLQRQFNVENKCACHNNFKMQGRPFAVCQNTECSSNGFQFDGETTTCIKLVSTSGTTWKDARKYCQQQEGGDLVSITSKAKWDFIMGNFNSVGPVWIGLKDKKWMTGESFNNIFGVTVQLNDYDGAYPSEVENSCGLLVRWSSNKLQDENCNIRKRTKFLCEIHM
ncbi:MRC [Mytilus coruscus]|uniref:MRC n=1 Tax=Mytilus coruscus TaxID=42192 RepID=A0A6J8EA96_MYTCO|nr:MRC [Mytilus coruscus]